jgi:hypothetical protein
MLNAAVEDLHRVGYVLKNEQEGYDQQGNRIVVKVLYCERNSLQVVIQTTRIPSVVDHIGLQEEDITVNTAVDGVEDKPDTSVEAQDGLAT